MTMKTMIMIAVVEAQVIEAAMIEAKMTEAEMTTSASIVNNHREITQEGEMEGADMMGEEVDMVGMETMGEMIEGEAESPGKKGTATPMTTPPTPHPHKRPSIMN